MSKRLLQRGRYPKGPGVEQVTNANSQFPQNPPATTSQMPFYDPSLQPQTTQNSWPQPPYSDPNAYQSNHPTYPDPNAYQHNQVHQQPVAEAAAYWSGSQMLPVSSQAPWNESWNYKPETVPDSANYASYQQPVAPATEQWQQPAQYSHNTNLNYPPQQPAAGFDQTYQTGYQHLTHDYPTTNNNSNVIPPNATPPWENGSIETAQPEHPPWAYSQYSETAPPPSQDLEHPDLIANSASWPQEPNNYVASSGVDYNVPDGTSANYLRANAENISTTASENTSHNPSPSIEQLEGSSEPIDLQLTNFEPVREKTSPSKEQSEFDYASSTLAAFFQNPDQEVLSTQPETDPAPVSGVELSSQKDVSSAPRENEVACVISNQIDVPGVVSDDDRLINNDPDDSRIANNEIGASRLVGNPSDVSGEISNQSDGSRLVDNLCDVVGLGSGQSDMHGETLEQVNGIEHEINFLQEERLLDVNLEDQCSSSISSSGFIEEPINQEVPEPHRNKSSIIQSQPVQEYEEIVTEDPPNQQVPTGSGQTSRSTSSERERIVIRPREESPFKPPRPSSSKGIVVQQEISIQSHPETKPVEGKTVVQEVNLETFPDNLERPSDYEELRKQSPLYASRKHLRSELNSSPSSLLCENLSIPCVTLAPAAPPLSSAKSDRSESSTDSKLENSAIGSCSLPAFKTNESSLSGSSCDIREEDTYPKPKDQHLSRKETTSNTLPSRTRETTRTYDTAPLKPTNNKTDAEKKVLHQPVYLKDSRLNGRDAQPLRQAVSNSEIPESRIPPSRNPIRDPKYHSDEMIDSRHDHPESRKFADQKYPSFDDRQYYSDRERSRPSSRTSMRERPEEFPYQPHKPDEYSYQSQSHRPDEFAYQSRGGDPRRYPQEQGRPSSRLSNESDTRRGDRQGYYQQPYGYPQNTYPRNPSEYYNRQPPNQRGYEREYDPYQRDPYYSSYYDAYRYAYSNYNYGFYDEFYRNDPRYKQYQEQCRQYYAKYGREGDYERSSVHSGRSSANELSKDVSRSGHYQEPDIDSNESEFSGYNLEQNYSYEDGQNEISNTEAASTPSSRLTPVKFSYPHPIARFSPGGMLITAIPNQLNTAAATTIRIHNLQVIREDEDSFKELKNYQGPLVRGSTHKNDVIEFCTQKIKTIQSEEDVVDRDSYTLLWELMVLLLRQNGSVAGSDIAELLLKDHEVLRPPSLALKQVVEIPQGEHSPADINDSSSQSHAGDTSSPDEGIVVLHDKTTLNTSGTVDVDKITRKFREFLLFGHKKDALEWAMKHGLWGHALFLASKMDLRTYANVMTRFANSLALNDPLQTLYQLMSGRQPLAVTNVADKKWGDWRPHLAMILSNPSAHPDVDSRSITTLGDTLANKGCLCAAHFCYIMAQVEFGTYEQTTSKFVLLTSDHSLPFEEFATNEAVQVTEIYEYAQSLANPSYLLVHLQFYKFLYAKRLVEHGFLEEALHYCEIIAGKVQDHPHFFQLDFISEVFNLATLLKYHDPHFLRGQGEFEDQDDPEWLKNLAELVKNFNNFPASEPPQQQPYIEQPPAEISPNQNVNSQQFAPQSNENITYNNVPNQATQNEVNNSYNNQMNYYQQSGWNQQNSLQNSTFSPTNSSLDNTGYYADSTLTNQSSFNRQNSLPSQEENETTDVPSSPVTQTPPFDYYSGGTQQEWSSAHSLPSACLSDATRKSKLKTLSRMDETESEDVALGSSSHSTPMHNYEKVDDDRRLLMTGSGLIDARTLNSCLKTSRSHGSKHKKCIKFDATASGPQPKTTGIRRRKFSKKKTEEADLSDSSPDGSPSKSKGKQKMSILATLGLLRPEDGSAKLSKRKRKAKKKSETLEKLLQSKKTFAIDEPCDEDERRWVQREKSMDESVQETKKIIHILNRLSMEEKKNSQLSQLMANEFNKKPPLIFGGTYPIDEPFESKPVGRKSKGVFVSGIEDQFVKGGKTNNLAPRRYKYCKPTSSLNRQRAAVSLEKSDRKIGKVQQVEGDVVSKLTPLQIFKHIHHSGKRFLHSKEDVSTSSKSTRSSSNTIEFEKESNVHENKSIYDTSNSYNNMSERERRDSAMSSGSRYSAGSTSVANKSSSGKETKPEAKKDKHTSQAGKTWLGGIFSRLLPKAPNQMILPDDKNPTIVWDDVNNCWVNKDSNDEDETNAPLAPPTDMELMGSKSSTATFHSPMPPPSTYAAPGVSVPPATTSLPANKFQRPKTRGMRQNYVDVLSTSGATKKNNIMPEALFPSPYESATSPQMFTPTPTSTALGENSTSDFEQSQVSYNSPQLEKEEPIENQATPLMFDPAAFDARRSNPNNQRPMLGQTGRRTYPT